MATLEIGIPGPGLSDFLATPIPPLTLSNWDNLPVRSLVNTQDISGFTINGTPLITGPSYQYRYTWAINKVDTVANWQHLSALHDWQQETKQALRMIDQTQFLSPEAIPHSRTLLASINPPWSASYEYGFGVHNVWINLVNDWLTFYGAKANQLVNVDNLATAQLTLVELSS